MKCAISRFKNNNCNNNETQMRTSVLRLIFKTLLLKVISFLCEQVEEFKIKKKENLRSILVIA